MSEFPLDLTELTFEMVKQFSRVLAKKSMSLMESFFMTFAKAW